MITHTQREKEFRDELNKLLTNHNAEITIASHYPGVYFIRVIMESRYDHYGDILKEHTEFDL